MNEKEIAEIRRRFQPQHSNIKQVHGCYVNSHGEVISQFTQSLATASEEEVENILSILKKALSGSLGKQLNDVVFDTQQVVDSDEHRMLMALRDSKLEDEGLVDAFYQRVIETLQMEEPYLILLAHDAYDVPYRAKDGAPNPDGSCEVYSYVLCGVCPMKETKPALRYDLPDSVICNRGVDWLISPPELGFLFPAFDDRSANIYNALYYTRKTAENHPEFVTGIFKTEPPMPADLQQETFREILSDALEEDCSYEVLQGVTEILGGMVEEHKASKSPEPLAVSKGALRKVLETCGVPEEKAESFEEKYEEAFGGGALNPKNLVNTREFVVRTENVTIKTTPDCGDLVETRLIDGRKYILVRVEGGVEVNGVRVTFPRPEEAEAEPETQKNAPEESLS